MMQDFFRKNKSTLLLIAAFIGGWIIVSLLADNSGNIDVDPVKGQIYILKEDDIYTKMYLDSIAGDNLYFFQGINDFRGAMPKAEQIISSDFDKNFHAIYNQVELDRLKENGTLVHIYPGAFE